MLFKEVGNDPQLKKEFINFPVRLYRNEARWIRPLDADIESVFDPETNKYFRNGVCTRWIAADEQGNTLGVIAVFIDHNTKDKDNEQPTGGIGFFECVEDKNIAFEMFDYAKNWLMQQGVEAMDGPINFGERDQWWGLLVDGYEHEPTYKMGWHFPYYKTFFEEYGFQTYFEQYTFFMPTDEANLRRIISPSVFEKADRIYASEEYDFEHISKKNLEKYAEDFRNVYNQAWVKHSGLGEMSSEKAKAILKRMKPILDEKLTWFGYSKGEPIAFFLAIPELNQLFKHVNGKMNWLGKLKFLWHQFFKTNTKAMGLIFGVVPEHQGKGVESAIALCFTKESWKKDFQYKEAELNWVGDFNPKMLRFVRSLGGGKPLKTYITYRYLFDQDKPFKRCPTMR